MSDCCRNMRPFGQTYDLLRSGTNVSELLEKIDSLGLVNYISDGLMSSADKIKLDNLRATSIKYNTKEYWDNARGYIPPRGELIIYADYMSKVVNGQTILLPAVKIGSGNAYVQDLAFLGDDIRDALLAHIADATRHITAQERLRWNNKLNVDDSQEVIGESLVFNRN